MRMIKAILAGLVLGVGAFVIKDKVMDKQIENKEKFAREIIGEITKLSKDKEQIISATMEAILITDIIDEYSKGVSKSGNYAKTIVKMSMSRCKRSSIKSNIV